MYYGVQQEFAKLDPNTETQDVVNEYLFFEKMMVCNKNALY